MRKSDPGGTVADIEALLEALTLEEKASLTAGGAMFSTAPVERLGIPVINLTDGPSGARGLSFPGAGGPSSACIPCGSAIGATWDPALAERLGALVATEAVERRARGWHIDPGRYAILIGRSAVDIVATGDVEVG